jgi:tetratricopeptide (TPR) repeat protein
MALPYREFACYIVRDLAVRTKTKRGGDFVFSGNHSSPYRLVRFENEPKEQFTARLKQFRAQFRKTIPRGSDSRKRLALAMEALIRLGWDSVAASAEVLEALDKAREATEARRLDLEKRGIPYRRVEFNIGLTNRGRRKKQKRSGSKSSEHADDPNYRKAETIRAEYFHFKRTFEGFEKLFESEFRLFRFSYHRDAEWFAEAEPELRQRITRCENDKDLGPNHSLTAGHSLTLARALHEQGRFEEAEMEYQRALDRWLLVNDGPPDDREFVISSILDDLTKCKNREIRPLLPRPDVVQ